MTGELAFFEIGVDDPAAGRAFYAAMFDWTLEPGPSEGGGFMIETPNVRGGMHGGDAGAAPYVFFAVDDMERTIERVRELGGSIDEMDVSGDDESKARYGSFKLCKDDQGSAFGLHLPPSTATPPEAGAQRRSGAVGHFQLGVEDTHRARAFYEALFGWTFVPGPTTGFIITGPGITGGMHGGDAGGQPYVFFVIDAMDTALERLQSLGGSVEAMDVEGDDSSQAVYGRFKLCKDDQGSSFGLHQPPA